jgi:F0F1-type ATP synthase delta subunit
VVGESALARNGGAGYARGTSIGDPNVSAQELESLILGVCGEQLDGAGRNFVQMLAQNDRLTVIPAIRPALRMI